MSEQVKGLAARLWVYQGERFPLRKMIPMLAVFSAASVTASANLGARALPPLLSYFVAFALVLVFFWQLRASDEFKDNETDRLHRPERPIPRGLVSLRLIIALGLGSAVPAIILALSISPVLAGLVVLAWLWMLAMLVEFGMPSRLHASPALYLVSHMAIMPLIDLVLTGCEWTEAGSIPSGLWTFIFMSFCNGTVMEIGRKTWAPVNERPGVESYSADWGIPAALAVLVLAAVAATFGLLAFGFYAGTLTVTAICGLPGLAWLVWNTHRFRASPTPIHQAALEMAGNLMIADCYLSAALSRPIWSLFS